MQLEGVYVPVVTPFGNADEVDLDGLTRVVEHCVGAGVRGIVAAGTTGEYYALSSDERLRIFTHIRNASAGRVQMVAGCNAGSTKEATRFAVAARDLGYNAIMLAAPPTSLPSQRELAAHFAAIAHGGGLPVILYNYPARAGVEIGFDCLDALVDNPQIIAIKESSGDFSRFLAMRKRYADRLTIMCGSDDQAVDYFAWGVRSWLAGTANALPAHHVAVMQMANAGNITGARALFDQMLPWVQACESGSYNQKAKLALESQGIDCGPVRAPLLPMAPDDATEFLAITKLTLDIPCS
jgi:4-hydroxy-tetrahydrodipicolinate synthase